MQVLTKGNVLIVSTVGLSYGWLPHGIALLKSHVNRHSDFQAETLSLCVKFSHYLSEEFPGLVPYDREMGEWGSSFHELYFSAQYFGHATPDELIRQTVTDLVHGTDLFAAAPWLERGTPMPELIDFHAKRILRYCELVDAYSSEQFLLALEEQQPLVVGFSCTAQQLFGSMMMARLAREKNPDIKIVVGGPAITGETIRPYLELFPEMDVVVRGDGEEVFVQILERLHEGAALDDLAGVYTRAGSGLQTVRAAKTPDLEAIPTADYSEVESIVKAADLPVTIWIARGCSWGKCAFCSIPDFQRHYLNRSADLVYQDLLALSEQHGTHKFRFGDWEVNGNPENLKQLCELLIQGNHGFEFWAEVNARKTSKELMELMRQAGFVNVQVGLESFSDKLLRGMRKPTDVAENIKFLIYAQETGLEIFSNILFNFPTEEEADIHENLRVLKLIRHLIKPPVQLAVTGFLLEVDADVYQTVREGHEHAGERYRFESRCWPEPETAPYFLEQWSKPIHPEWHLVQEEIDLCYEREFSFTHQLEDDGVVLFDDRSGTDEIVQLSGTQADLYKQLIHRITSQQDLLAALPHISEEQISRDLQDLIQRGYIIHVAHRLLALSVSGGKGDVRRERLGS